MVSPASSPGSEINAFFTRDYNMNHANMKHAGAQGGFLVLRPSQQVYDEFVSIIRKGDFRQGSGWGGEGFGPFYGVSGLCFVCNIGQTSLLWPFMLIRSTAFSQ